ncbi:hypothetical protein F4780DRAFT_776037 [Xylariomycetidae sp. FL0641]|nr:hypothetical protein F4780DRAFT_776037 [Xylariomycetidae sp. FL0641]
MLPLVMEPSDFAAEFKVARQEFLALRARFTRSTYAGHEFVLVGEVTAALGKRSDTCADRYSNDLERLANTGHHTHYLHQPELSMAELQNYLSVFYTLVEMDCPHYICLFRERGLDDHSLPLDLDTFQRTIRAGEVADYGNFFLNFHARQRAWSPVTFDLHMGTSYNQRIVPLCRKTKIEPYRDGYIPEEKDSTLWKVEIPEELMTTRLKDKLTFAMVQRELDTAGAAQAGQAKVTGKYYQCVLKQFSPSRKALFTKENIVASGLKSSDGIVLYIGWFQSTEVGLNGSTSETFNIVYEPGEMDFYTVIRKRAPPASPKGIEGLWTMMLHLSCALKEIHLLTIEPEKYIAYHGDIKPENILLVNGILKLADSGEGRIEVSTASAESQVRATGGTLTYASPEKSRSMKDSNVSVDRTLVPRADVWALGCAFSIAATFVVLGEQGVLKYDRLRQEANKRRIGVPSDLFHDDYQVLREVTAWHAWLRSACRKTDAITPAVLDVLDNHVLKAIDSRIDSLGLVKHMADAIQSSNQSSSDVPAEIQEFLDQLDESSLLAEKSDQLAGNDGAGATDSPQRAFKSTQALLSQTVLPVLHYQGPETPNPQSTPKQGCSGRSGRPSTVYSVTQESTLTVHNAFKDVWMVEYEMEKLTKRGLLGSLGGLKLKERSVKEAKLRSLHDELQGFFTNRDIVFLVDNSPSMNPHWKHASKVMHVLAWRALSYDEDGMELYFSNPETKAKVDRKQQGVLDFDKAMKAGEPQLNKQGPRATITPVLARIMTNFTSSYSGGSTKKSKTIIVLTDGVWEDVDGEHSVDTLIKTELPRLGWDQSEPPEQFAKKRLLTIQFIRFGYHPQGMERLRRLDDDLREAGIPDIVDTEPATGDVYKMFLGSLSDEMDHSSNMVNSATRYSISSPLSPSSASSPFVSSPSGHHSGDLPGVFDDFPHSTC